MPIFLEEAFYGHVGVVEFFVGQAERQEPDLRYQSIAVAGLVFQHPAHDGVRTVSIGHVEIADSLVVGLGNDLFEFIDAHSDLFRSSPSALHAGAHADPRDLKPLAQGDRGGGIGGRRRPAGRTTVFG